MTTIQFAKKVTSKAVPHRMEVVIDAPGGSSR